MPTITVRKADETGGKETEPATINISADLPPFDYDTPLEEVDLNFVHDALAIEAALYTSLPGGTYDRLLGLMLQRKATHFRVSHAT